MPEVIDRFAAEHFTLNSISGTRRVRVLRALDQYAAWLGETPIEQATATELRQWLVHLKSDGRQASTVAWYLKMIRPFYRWAWRERIIDADAWLRIKDVAPPRGYDGAVPRPYSGKELAQMWAALDEKFPLTTRYRITRWRNGNMRFRGPLRRHAMRLQLDAIIELALVCGLRRNEIYNLSIDDVHPDNKYIVVHGKRHDQHDKVREVPYPESTRNAIREWFRMRLWMQPAPGLKLWLSITGPEPAAELSTERMATILHSFGPWTLHRLRHTCATERLRAGMALQDLQKFLGHSNINMTLRYAQLVREDIHKASERIDADFQRAIRRKAA